MSILDRSPCSISNFPASRAYGYRHIYAHTYFVSHTLPNTSTDRHITDVLYSFADVSASTGAISLTDPYADEQVRVPFVVVQMA